MKEYGIALAGVFAALLVAQAEAQTGNNYNLPGMNFDMWCQEQARLPPDRCDKRTPEDEKTFETYRSRIDQYEIPYLRAQQDQLSIHRDIMQSDPVDNPVAQAPSAQDQDPNRQPPMPPP